MIRLTVPRLQRVLLVLRVLDVLADGAQLTLLAMCCDGIVAWTPTNGARIVAITGAIAVWLLFAVIMVWHWFTYGRHLGNALRTSDTMWTMRHYGDPVTGQLARSLAIMGLLVLLLALPTLPLFAAAASRGSGGGTPPWHTAWPAVPVLLLVHIGGGVVAMALHGTHLLILDCGGLRPPDPRDRGDNAREPRIIGITAPKARRKQTAQQHRTIKLAYDKENSASVEMPSIYDSVEPLREDEDVASVRTISDDDDEQSHKD